MGVVRGPANQDTRSQSECEEEEEESDLPLLELFLHRFEKTPVDREKSTDGFEKEETNRVSEFR